ncbi:serine/threonine-protein kinase [Streptomyces sp. 7R007]
MSEADRRAEQRVVDGRFALEARLGGGGMGTVWRARDLMLHRQVAVKEVRPPDPDLAEYDPEGARMLRERVLREARALARIDHPNVVTIHHIVDGGEGTYPWIVMELVVGGSLADRLAQGPLPPAEAARIGRGVLAALTAAHHAGVEHRDVKPANVLLRPDGRPVLTDFGIAAIRELTNLTATGAIIGTPDFMAPERVAGQEGGAASDLWSLAMMLYAAVEGHHPLRRGTTLATLAAILQEDVPPPVRAGALSEALVRVLVRDPSARPTAAELDRMLGEAAEEAEAEAGGHLSDVARSSPRDTPTSYPLAPPSGAPRPGPPTVSSPSAATRRTPARAALVTATTVCLLGAAVLAWWLIPLGGDAAGAKGGASAGTSAHASVTASTRRTTDSSTPPADQSGGLLTPDGVRAAVAAFKKATGRDRFGDFTVFADYASARMMVKGSDSAYDSYTYRPGEGVKKGLISGTLSGGVQPVSLDGFDWDRVPALFAEADKKLNVKNPESRYLTVRQPNTAFHTPAGMAVYLAGKYGAGYVEADTKGKVTEVSPADG